MPDTFTPEQISQILEEFFKVVGTRQYIGARYVPIFGRKDETSIEWDNTKPYEPLTIVLYQGNSYTSRQFVPVGVEITNQEFWAITGNYNAQVEMYRRETAAAREVADSALLAANAAQTDIDTLLPKADFSAENTVKDYVDNSVAVVQADINTLLPKADFDAENTVKDAIDAAHAAANNAQDDIDTLLPKNAFSAVNNVKKYIDNSVFDNAGISYVGNYGAIEKNNAVNWQAIVNQIATVSETIDFGSGQWYVNAPITIPIGIRNIVATGAILTATAEMETIFSVAGLTVGNTKRFVVFNGLSFDGATLANCCIKNADDAGNNFQIFNCSFRDYNNYGIYSRGLGSFVSNCVFANQTNQNTGCAFSGTTDNIIENCKVFYNKTAFAVGAATIQGCYVFTQHMTEPSYGVAFYQFEDGIAPTSHTTYLCVNNCEFDCITYAFANVRFADISNCFFYWNGNDDVFNTHRGIFYENGNLIESINFNDNRIDLDTNNLILGTVDTFVVSSTYNNHTINSYNSHGCFSSLMWQSNASALEIFNICCGFRKKMSQSYNTNGASTGANAYNATKFIPIASTSTQNYTHEIETGRFSSVAKRLGGSITNKSLATTTNLVIGYAYDSTSTANPFYLQCVPFDITEINLTAGLITNMAWAPITEALDNSLTVVANTVI